MTELNNEEKIGLPTICLGIYFLAMPFDSFSAFGIGSLTKVFILLPIAAVVLERNTKLYFGNLSKILLLYLVYFSASLYYAISFEIVFTRVTTLSLNVLAVLCVAALRNVYNKKEIVFLKKALIGGGIATIVLTLLFSDFSVSGRLTMGINGDTQDQNYINGYMMFAFVAFTSEVVKKKKALYLIPAVGIIFFILFTGSRGALLAFFGVAIVVILFSMYSQGKSVRAILLILALFIMAYFSIDYVVAILPESVAMRFSREYLQTHATTGRTDIWKYLFQVFKDSSVLRQLFGYGFGATGAVNHMGGTFNGLPAHNLWVDHLIMGGLIGESIFVIMIYYYIRAALSSRDIFLIGSYAGFLFMMMSLSLISYKPIWNCMMMIIIITQNNEEIALEDNDDMGSSIEEG